MKLDILAIGAHPDDVELSCSGTLMLHKLMGQKTGILDLTQGELGSRGSVEIRQQESAHASEILQLDIRENLSFKDGFFQNDEHHQLEIIKISTGCFCTKKGFLPIAEKIQKQIMQFKTNYRNLHEAINNAEILNTILKKIETKCKI